MNGWKRIGPDWWSCGAYRINLHSEGGAKLYWPYLAANGKLYTFAVGLAAFTDAAQVCQRHRRRIELAAAA